MSNYEIPYWKKYTLSIEEAAAYFRIGEGKLRKLVSENPNAMKSFIEAYKEAYKKLKTEGKTIERLKEKFEELGKDGYSYLTGDDYTEFGGKYYDPKSEKEKDAIYSIINLLLTSK
mgnify:CR=1 FL=1